MSIEESYETIGDDLDLENLDGVPLEELRRIRRAMGHDVEGEEAKFLELLRSYGLLRDPQDATQEKEGGECQR